MLPKCLLLAKKSIKYQSDNRSIIDCVQQVFQQSIDQADKSEALEICLSNVVW